MTSVYHPDRSATSSVKHNSFRVRPHYPTEALSYIRGPFSGKSNLRIVEYVFNLCPLPCAEAFLYRIGAGTGIFTRDLLNHKDWSNCISEIIAVEPNTEMRRVFARETTHPEVKVIATDGTFERTNVEDGWADMIIMATVSETHL